VESKKQLVKISHVAWMSMLRELQEMDVEKVAFGPAEAKRVLQIAKGRVIKVPRLRQTATRAAQEMMEGRMPKGLTFAEQALMQGGGAPMAVHPSAASKLRQVVSSGAVAEGAVPPSMIQGAERLRGRILTAKGGDATLRVRQHPMVGDVVQGPISQMTPEQRMMHNAVIKRHEMAELGINKKFRGPEPFGMGTGHMGAEAPLTDHTVLATLPKGNEPIREAVQGYRGTEANLLERATRGVGGRPGMEFGAEGQRLTRHARKRVGRRMEELAGQDLQAALADPETGEALRQQFKAMGIKEIAGVGKLAAAPEEVVQAERRRLLRKAGPAAGALLGAGVGALRGMKKGRLLANVVGGLGTGATLGWIPDIAATAREARQRYQKVVK